MSNEQQRRENELRKQREIVADLEIKVKRATPGIYPQAYHAWLAAVRHLKEMEKSL